MEAFMEANWYCVRCKPHKEEIVVRELKQRHEIEAFFPKISRRQRRQVGTELRIEPLFPTYVFARLVVEESWLSIEYTPAVLGLVRFGDRIPVVPEELINELASVELNSEIFEDKAVQMTAEVIICGGPLDGVWGQVVRLGPRDRVRLLVDWLGRKSYLDLSIAQVLARGRE
jgi:transcriptional antiterminator RfaH